jgi:hypothetical protein
MSKKILAQVLSEVCFDDLDPVAQTLLERAVKIAEAERTRWKGDRRRWSEKGTVYAELMVLEVRDEILPLAYENHKYNHRLFRAFPCDRRCMARDLWATLWLCVKVIDPPKDWPIRKLLTLLIEDASGYKIAYRSVFADQVVRDLSRLPAVLAIPWRKRSVPERRLAATYNVASKLFPSELATSGKNKIPLLSVG